MENRQRSRNYPLHHRLAFFAAPHTGSVGKSAARGQEARATWKVAVPTKFIEEESFKLKAAEFAGSIQRWDEISWAITHDIARNPHFVVPPCWASRTSMQS